jgi:hypothetical protein
LQAAVIELFTKKKRYQHFLEPPYMIMVNRANDEQLWGPVGKRSWTITFSAPYCPNFIPKELHWADGKNHLANPANRKPTDPYNLSYGMSVTFVLNLSFLFNFFIFILLLAYVALQRIRKRWYEDPHRATGASMFKHCEVMMLKWMKEQKKLDADFFLELSDEAQDINELGGFSDDDIASWERELVVQVYGQGVADMMPELGSESELEDEGEDDE